MQIVYIDLIPQKEKPIVNLSQYDNDRVVRFMLLENGEEYTLTGTETIDVNIKKPDGNIVVITPTVAANHYVDVLFTEQAAACYGQSVGELSIKENSTIIGTCNFIMDVEKSPTCGGIQSATEIENLQSQIDDIISGEGYLKAEDVAQVALSGDYNDLTNKPDMSDYYTKSQTDALLNNKVDNSTLGSYYTKSQTDALLNNKVDNSTLGSYYTKSETEALIDDRLLGILPVETATGNPCSFDMDIAAELQGLTADIVASGGGGTPDNPNPINGYSSANITRCGVNLWDEEWENGAINVSTGESISMGSRYRSANYVPITPLTSFYALDTEHSGLNLCFYDVNKTYLGSDTAISWIDGIFTSPSGACYMKMFWSGSGDKNISINYPSSVTTYQPYNGQTFTVQFGQTVYGGVYDANTGKIRITWGIINLSTLNWGYIPVGSYYPYGVFFATINDKKFGAFNILCDSYETATESNFLHDKKCLGNSSGTAIYITDGDYTDATAFKNTLANVNMIYELATPIEIDVSELSVDTIVGVNNIVSDGNGDVMASYKVSIQKYIDDRT